MRSRPRRSCRALARYSGRDGQEPEGQEQGYCSLSHAILRGTHRKTSYFSLYESLFLERREIYASMPQVSRLRPETAHEQGFRQSTL